MSEIIKFDGKARNTENVLKEAVAERFENIIFVGFRADGGIQTRVTEGLGLLKALGAVRILDDDLVRMFKLSHKDWPSE